MHEKDLKSVHGLLRRPCWREPHQKDPQEELLKNTCLLRFIGQEGSDWHPPDEVFNRCEFLRPQNCVWVDPAKVDKDQRAVVCEARYFAGDFDQIVLVGVCAPGRSGRESWGVGQWRWESGWDTLWWSKGWGGEKEGIERNWGWSWEALGVGYRYYGEGAWGLPQYLILGRERQIQSFKQPTQRYIWVPNFRQRACSIGPKPITFETKREFSIRFKPQILQKIPRQSEDLRRRRCVQNCEQ